MFGMQQQQEAKVFPSPEAKQLMGELMFHSTEVFSKTYIPLVLVNRPYVIQHLKDAKVTLDKLLKVI